MTTHSHDAKALRAAAHDYLRGRDALRSLFPEITPSGIDRLALVLTETGETTPTVDKKQTPKKPTKKKNVVKAKTTPKATKAKKGPTKAAKTKKSVPKTAKTKSAAPIVIDEPREAHTVLVDVGRGAQVPLLHAIVCYLEREPNRSATLNGMLDGFRRNHWTVVTRNPDPRYPMRAAMKRRGDAFTWQSTYEGDGPQSRELFRLHEGVQIPQTDRQTIEGGMKRSNGVATTIAPAAPAPN